jgi:hypothetical protein
MPQLRRRLAGVSEKIKRLAIRLFIKHECPTIEGHRIRLGNPRMRSVNDRVHDSLNGPVPSHPQTQSNGSKSGDSGRLIERIFFSCEETSIGGPEGKMLLLHQPNRGFAALQPWYSASSHQIPANK